MSDELNILDAKDGINKTIPVSQDAIGFYKLGIDTLPSQGLFYPKDMHISIKPAQNDEIKHWSAIDESDDYSVANAIDFILSKCLRVQDGKKMLSHKHLVEVDRLYLIFAIRDITFKDENSHKVMIDVPYVYSGTEYKDSIVITKELINYFVMPEELEKYYDELGRVFNFEFKDSGSKLNMRLPSIGMVEWVQSYVSSQISKSKKVDEYFATIYPFIYNDFEDLTEDVYRNKEIASVGWDDETISLISKVNEMLKGGVKTTIKHKTKNGGMELQVPFKFRDGFKSIFIIPNIFERLA